MDVRRRRSTEGKGVARELLVKLGDLPVSFRSFSNFLLPPERDLQVYQILI